MISISSLLPYGYLITIIAGIIVFWIKGGSKAANAVVDLQKERIDLLEKRVSTCEQLHREAIANIGSLQGSVSEKNNRITTLEALIQNRNPELEQFIAESKKTFDLLVQYMTNGKEIFTLVKDYMDSTKHTLESMNTFITSPTKN